MKTKEQRLQDFQKVDERKENPHFYASYYKTIALGLLEDINELKRHEKELEQKIVELEKKLEVHCENKIS
jgi:hypothetical protein